MNFSNENIFKFYLYVRGGVLIFVFLGVLIRVLNAAGDLFNFINTNALFCLVVLLFLDSYIDLNYLNVFCDSKLKETFISVYKPDRNLFIYFRKSKVKTKKIPKNGIISYKYRNKSFLSKKIILKVIGKEESYKVGEFNLLGITKENLSVLMRIIENHNKEVSIPLKP